MYNAATATLLGSLPEVISLSIACLIISVAINSVSVERNSLFTSLETKSSGDVGVNLILNFFTKIL